MRYFLIIVLILSSSNLYCQYTIIPTETSETLTDIYTEGDFTLVLGNSKYIGKCHGKCDDIFPIFSPTPEGFTQSSLSLIDTNTYSMLSKYSLGGMIFTTENGGSSWYKILDTTNYNITKAVMFDKDTGSVISTFYKSLWTGDAGANWTNTNHGHIITSELKRLNDSTAIMGTLERFSYTTDKGQSWQGDGGFVQSLPRAFSANSLDTIYAVCSSNNGVYFTYTHDLLGTSWIHQTLPSIDPYGICVKSWDEIYFLGQDVDDNYSILKTTDLGITYQSFNLDMEGTFMDMHFIKDSFALVSGTNGLLIRLNVNSIFETVSTKDFDTKLKLLHIYPNPVSDQLYLNQKINDIDRIEIRDLNGKLMMNKLSFPIDVSNFSSGSYVITLFSSKNIFQTKFIKP